MRLAESSDYEVSPDYSGRLHTEVTAICTEVKRMTVRFFRINLQISRWLRHSLYKWFKSLVKLLVIQLLIDKWLRLAYRIILSDWWWRSSVKKFSNVMSLWIVWGSGLRMNSVSDVVRCSSDSLSGLSWVGSKMFLPRSWVETEWGTEIIYH
jgi:hypothetical protein